MDKAIGRQDFFFFNSIGFIRKVRNRSPCFFGNDHACGCIPRRQILFPEPLKSATGHIAQVQSGRAQAANALGGREASLKALQQGIDDGLQFVGETCNQQALAKGVGAGDMDRPIIESRSMASRPTEEFFGHRIQDQPKEKPSLMSESDRDTEFRQAVGVIRGAVQGVYDPFVRVAAQRDAAFLGKDRMLGEGRANELDDRPFRGQVGLGHQIDGPLFLYGVRFTPVVPKDIAGSGGSCQADGPNCFKVHNALLPNS